MKPKETPLAIFRDRTPTPVFIADANREPDAVTPPYRSHKRVLIIVIVVALLLIGAGFIKLTGNSSNGVPSTRQSNPASMTNMTNQTLTIRSKLQVEQSMYILGDLIVKGKTTMGQGLNVTGDGYFSGDLTISGTLQGNVLDGKSYAVNGVAGGTASCTNGDVLVNASIQGGIFTGGSCTAPSKRGGGSAGVASLNGQSGVVNTANASAVGGVVTIDNARADGSTKGISAFNPTNFTATSGVINTAQDIATSSTPTFASLTVLGNSSTAFQVQDASGVAFLTSDSSTLTLTVKNVVITASLTVNGHIITGNSSGSTTVALGAAGSCAAGAPIVSISGNDTAGSVTITTGTNCSAGTLATITFANAFGSAPNVVLTPKTLDSAELLYYNGTTGTSSFTIDVVGNPNDNTTCIYSYQVIQ